MREKVCFSSSFLFMFGRKQTPEIRKLAPWKTARHRAYYECEWQRRLATYQHRCTISEFSRQWTTRRWRLDSGIMYPPVDIDNSGASKEPLILSVGRFSTMAHTKKQMEMMCAFQRGARSISGVELCTRGRVEHTCGESRLLRPRADGRRRIPDGGRGQCRSAATDQRTLLVAHAFSGMPRVLVRIRTQHPELSEHFGIATVEAMSAGCVPVVINRGGQSTSSVTGENGFLWNTLDEMHHYTLQSRSGSALWTRMSCGRRARAAQFSRAHFIGRMTEACLDEADTTVAAARRTSAGGDWGGTSPTPCTR